MITGYFKLVTNILSLPRVDFFRTYFQGNSLLLASKIHFWSFSPFSTNYFFNVFFYILDIKIFLMPDKSLFYDSLSSDSNSRRTETLLLDRLWLRLYSILNLHTVVNHSTAVNHTKNAVLTCFYMWLCCFTMYRFSQKWHFLGEPAKVPETRPWNTLNFNDKKQRKYFNFWVVNF